MLYNQFSKKKCAGKKMHIILSILTILMYVLWISDSLRKHGISLSTLNPFSMMHRARWARQRYANPLYNLSDACDIMTVLLISLIKSTGEITTEQKKIVLQTLCRQFSLSSENASHYFAHCSFLMRDTVDILEAAEKVIKPLIGNSTDEQISNVRNMMTEVATEAGKVSPNAYQQALINKVMSLLEYKTPSL